MGEKTEINSVEAVRGFPAFPVVLAAVGNGESNVITIGLVHVFSFSPTVIGVGISPSRYSHELFHKASDFSINIPGKELVEEVIFCGVSSGRDVDKFLDAGFHSHPGKKIKSPVIEDCVVTMECVKIKTIDVGDHTWFLGEVVYAEEDPDYEREKLLMYWSGEFRTIGEVIRKK
jgi:flavin reductase (DIM6/NTAB) family NADH-FMN oxidoreductase RutF